jgi:predicted nuclease of predicted toxin-antitoxin system
MKFFADENFPRRAVLALLNAGIEVVWLTTDMSGASDEFVLSRANREGWTLLTLDKDFGELVFRRGLPATNGIILFRLDAATPANFVEVVLTTVLSRSDWGGHFTVVSRDRIRMIPLAKQR